MNDTIQLVTGIDTRPGDRMIIDGNLACVEHVVDGQVTLEDLKTRRTTVLEPDELLRKWASGRLHLILPEENAEQLGAANDNLHRSFDSFPEHLQDRAVRAHRYATTALDEMPSRLSNRALEVLIRRVANDIGDTKPPSARSIRRWIMYWNLSGGDMRVLIPCDHAKGNRPHISPALAEMVNEAISEVGLRREKTTVASIKACVNEWLAEWNKRVLPGERLEMPSSKVFYRAIRHWDPYEIAVAKMGKEAADRHFRPAFMLPRPEHPLHIVQIDHTKINLMTCVRGRVVVRRAWLTAALDQFSRMIVGLVIGYDPPGTKPVLAVLRNMILPKDQILKRYPDIKHDWPCHGRPMILLVDNGKEFHGRALVLACQRLGIELRYCEAGRPDQKAHVERFFRTINDQLIHQVPGTTFENPAKKGDYDSEAKAVVDFDLLGELIHLYVVDIYHAQYHRGLQATPRAVWEEGVAKQPPALPRSVDDVLTATLVDVENPKALHHYGVELFGGLRYNSYELSLLRPAVGQKQSVRVRYDPDDLSRVWVLNESTGKIFAVSSTDLEYTSGLTQYQHDVIRWHARELYGVDKPTKVHLLEQRALIFAKIREAQKTGHANTPNTVRFAGTQSNSSHEEMFEAAKQIPASSDGFSDLYETDDEDAFTSPGVSGPAEYFAPDSGDNSEEDDIDDDETDIDFDERARMYESRASSAD